MFLSPAFAFFTKIIKPSILAIPSPSLPVSVISTVYSLPVSTGFEEPFSCSVRNSLKVVFDRHYGNMN